MLVDDPTIGHYSDNPFLRVVAAMNEQSPETPHVRTGVYEIGHFGSCDFTGPSYINWIDMDELPHANPGKQYFPHYGVCDSVKQILAACPAIEESKTRQFVITLTRVRRANQPAEGGWRWHKWGPYIGTHDIQCEYLHDEQGIEEVFVYHVYEKRVPKLYDHQVKAVERLLETNTLTTDIEPGAGK